MIVLVVIVLVVIVLVVIVLVVIVPHGVRWAMGDGRWPMQAQEPLRTTLHVLFAQ